MRSLGWVKLDTASWCYVALLARWRQLSLVRHELLLQRIDWDFLCPLPEERGLSAEGACEHLRVS